MSNKITIFIFSVYSLLPLNAADVAYKSPSKECQHPVLGDICHLGFIEETAEESEDLLLPDQSPVSQENTAAAILMEDSESTPQEATTVMQEVEQAGKKAMPIKKQAGQEAINQEDIVTAMQEQMPVLPLQEQPVMPTPAEEAEATEIVADFDEEPIVAAQEPATIAEEQPDDQDNEALETV
ncbi:hypothetical protein M1466_03540 [Candidatus Dependentiae bacterium]|nr:hypothetical protein [Candidatus Dependentiae bacterium]